MTEIETAQNETRRLLDALSDPDPDKAEIKDALYSTCMAVRSFCEAIGLQTEPGYKAGTTRQRLRIDLAGVG